MDGIVRRGEQTPYSEDDMRRLCEGKVNVMTYREAVMKGSIDSILGPHRAAILLIEVQPNYGHWVALFERRKGELEWFDSYGLEPEAELKMVPERFRKVSMQDRPRLVDMINREGYERLYWNNRCLQSEKKDVSTCGRWAAMRIVLRRHSLKEFQKMFTGQRLPADDYIVMLTLFNQDKF